MSKISNFMGSSDQPNCEKLIGTYGCKYCDKNMDFAWWDPAKQIIFWVCPDNHRSEQQFV